mmetsp:Transcript_21046/g.34814  ORF Transcript_21046/g.34814 Transcript_21046/m.34814 type:complete len:195 (+) Transcript_21046:23-607(+)
MRSLLWIIVLCAAGVHAALNDSNDKSGACERIHPEDLPDECTCSEPHPLSLVVECRKPFNSIYFNDTIGMKIVIDPCDEQGSSISLDITEEKHHIDYAVAGIRAGEEKNIPIPGLSIAVPTIGNLGLDAAVLIKGNVDKLTLKVGLNACAAIRHKNICASSIPGLHTILPWWVLRGTYSFGDMCNSTRTTVKKQ